MEQTTSKPFVSLFIAIAEWEESTFAVKLLDRLYSEEELPNEFKLFVPQAQKNKKAVSISPNFSKAVKENNPPNNGGESVAQNKSEIPEESLHQDVKEEEDHHQNEEEEMHVEQANESAMDA